MIVISIDQTNIIDHRGDSIGGRLRGEVEGLKWLRGAEEMGGDGENLAIVALMRPYEWCDRKR